MCFSPASLLKKDDGKAFRRMKREFVSSERFALTRLSTAKPIKLLPSTHPAAARFAHGIQLHTTLQMPSHAA
jgi:hypothetical protein